MQTPQSTGIGSLPGCERLPRSTTMLRLLLPTGGNASCRHNDHAAVMPKKTSYHPDDWIRKSSALQQVNMPAPSTLPPKWKVTPLGIVAAFVTLTEAVLGFAVTQVTGGVQVALATFFIVFAILVAGAFFAILWYKAYVFYPPSEYGDADPTKFIDAMKGSVPSRIAQQIEMVNLLEQSPQNAEATFKLIDSLIDESIRQHLILMREKNVALPFRSEIFGHRFELAKNDGHFQFGGISGKEIAEKLKGTDLVRIDSSDLKVHLTDLGVSFADWLVQTNRKADYFKTFFGGWGERRLPQGMPSELIEHVQRQSPEQFQDEFHRAFGVAPPSAHSKEAAPRKAEPSDPPKPPSQPESDGE